MSKEVQMTFRVEPELRARFTKAAKSEHRPVAQVLREFMRAYVILAKDKKEKVKAEKKQTISAQITEEQRRKRQDAINFARASIGLEGFHVSPETEAIAKRFIEGEIGMAKFIEALHESS